MEDRSQRRRNDQMASERRQPAARSEARTPDRDKVTAARQRRETSQRARRQA